MTADLTPKASGLELGFLEDKDGDGGVGRGVVLASSRSNSRYLGFNFFSLIYTLSFRAGAALGGKDLSFFQLLTTCNTWVIPHCH